VSVRNLLGIELTMSYMEHGYLIEEKTVYGIFFDL
jgi:hypothetical protein